MHSLRQQVQTLESTTAQQEFSDFPNLKILLESHSGGIKGISCSYLFEAEELAATAIESARSGRC